MPQVGFYGETWSTTWTTDPTHLMNELMTQNPGVTIVNLSFAQPDTTYYAGQRTFANTGLEFQEDFMTVRAAVLAMVGKGVKVMLSVGGGSYWSTSKTFNVNNVLSLMTDLGCSGIDLDWEVGIADSFSLTNAIILCKQAGAPLVSFAGFSTGAYPGNVGDPYKGMCISPMQQAGKYVDWINIMVGLV